MILDSALWLRTESERPTIDLDFDARGAHWNVVPWANCKVVAIRAERNGQADWLVRRKFNASPLEDSSRGDPLSDSMDCPHAGDASYPTYCRRSVHG